MTELADRLKAARGAAGYQSGSDAARAFGWPVSTYLGHENGDRRPGLKTIERYARAFRVDPSYIAYGTKEDIDSKLKQGRLIDIFGYVRDGGSILISDCSPGALEYLELDLALPESTYAVVVETSELMPRYAPDDVLVIVGSSLGSHEAMGDYFVFRTASGKAYFAQYKLINPSGRTVLFWKDISNVIVYDANIEEIGVVALVIPGWNIKKTFFNDLDLRVLSTLDTGTAKTDR